MLNPLSMRKFLISMGSLAAVASLAFALTASRPDASVNDEFDLEVDQSEQDWNSCIEKVGSEWGGQCMTYGFTDAKYTVHLSNLCNQKVDLMCCVQYDNGRWQCFYRMDMNQNDTLHSYACKGTGKYLKWVRKAGDVTTKFPTRDQVNNDY